MSSVANIVQIVPENPVRPGIDVLEAEIGKTRHYIHNAMATVGEAMTVNAINKKAETLARKGGYQPKSKTFAYQTTRNHLGTMERKGFAEQTSDGRWQLTALAWQFIQNPPMETATQSPSQPRHDIRGVDDKGRLLLPKEFASATVTIERVGENEIRIRKVVVVPVDEFPLIEDQLKPLSDRDRDLFLSLLDNPPEPTPSFLKAAKEYRKRHG